MSVLRGDCRELMRSLPENSVDAIVTDPPYELGFMGKSWDSAGVSFDAATWAEALRVLKPGGHLLAFGGSRTYHRIAVAIEDAGFEIRDTMMWLYGSGFPKSHDVSKAIDKAAGAEQEVVGKKVTGNARTQVGWAPGQTVVPVTAPATDEAKRWEGWGTALKPAHEPIVVARKPLIGTVAANVLEFGTGAMNIDANRIAADGESFEGLRGRNNGFVARRLDETEEDYAERVNNNPSTQVAIAKLKNLGRWPANVLFDEEAAKQLDASTPAAPSRFFYVAKTGTKERNAGTAANTHPTVKPIALMRHLVRLVTPPGGVVLDPFLGSGSTACAAVLEGFDYIGMEMDATYADIAEARIAHWKDAA
jgi:hypothetical protein